MSRGQRLSGQVLTHDVQVSLGANRIRVTILGFNLTLVFFLVGSLIEIGRVHQIRATWVFLPAFAQVATGFSLTVAAMLMILVSQRLDAIGSSRSWAFVGGESLMCLALAQTLSAGLQLFVTSFALTFRVLPAELAATQAPIVEILEIGDRLTWWIHSTAAIVWFAVVYVAPGAFLGRLPVPGRRKLSLAAAYLAVLMVVFWISSIPYHAHARARGHSGIRAGYFVQQFWQPALWRDPLVFDHGVAAGVPLTAVDRDAAIEGHDR